MIILGSLESVLIKLDSPRETWSCC